MNRSHLIAQQFGGSHYRENIVPLIPAANQKLHKSVEGEVKARLNLNERVFYAVIAHYSFNDGAPLTPDYLLCFITSASGKLGAWSSTTSCRLPMTRLASALGAEARRESLPNDWSATCGAVSCRGVSTAPIRMEVARGHGIALCGPLGGFGGPADGAEGGVRLGRCGVVAGRDPVANRLQAVGGDLSRGVVPELGASASPR
jgi:hypothetical protein